MSRAALTARERIRCELGDLTEQRVDAIVDAANEGLRGGGGVDGAVHAAAGPGLLAECRRLHPEGCPTGEARLTGGHALPARYVIHTVGPIWRGGAEGEAGQLAACHRNSLSLAARHGIETIAFPAISTGVFGYPRELAAGVALRAVAETLVETPAIRSLRFVLFDEALLRLFEEARAALPG